MATYDTTLRILTIQIKNGQTTASKVKDAVTACASFSALFNVSLDTNSDPGNSGLGVINALTVITSQRYLLYRSDGTASGTALVRNFEGPSR